LLITAVCAEQPRHLSDDCMNANFTVLSLSVAAAFIDSCFGCRPFCVCEPLCTLAPARMHRRHVTRWMIRTLARRHWTFSSRLTSCSRSAVGELSFRLSSHLLWVCVCVCVWRLVMIFRWWQTSQSVSPLLKRKPDGGI